MIRTAGRRSHARRPRLGTGHRGIAVVSGITRPLGKLGRRPSVGNDTPAHGLLSIAFSRVIDSRQGHCAILVAFRHHPALSGRPGLGSMLIRCLPKLVRRRLLKVLPGGVHLWPRHGSKRLRSIWVAVQGRTGSWLMQSWNRTPGASGWQWRTTRIKPRRRRAWRARIRAPRLLMLLLQVLGLRGGDLLGPGTRGRALPRIMAVCHVVVGRSRSRGLLLVVISLAGARRRLAMHARGGRHCVRPSLIKHWRNRGRCHSLGPAWRRGSAKDV